MRKRTLAISFVFAAAAAGTARAQQPVGLTLGPSSMIAAAMRC